MHIPFLLLFCLIFAVQPFSGAEPMLETDLFVSGEDGIAFYRIPALAATAGGTLIAVCDGRVERLGDAPNNIDLVMKRSFDGGRTWTPLKTILDYPGQEAATDPCIFTDRITGAVWIFFDYSIPLEGLHRNRKIWLYAMKSDDNGETWSEPVNLSSQLQDPDWNYIAASPGTAIQASGGRLVVPVYSVRGGGKEQKCHIVYSDDHGRTWNIGDETGKNHVEPQVVQLSDGTLIMNMRQMNKRGCRAVAESHDTGETWSPVRDIPALIGPECQASCIGCPSDKADNVLLFSNPASASQRIRMTVRMSGDGGKTWNVSRCIHDGPSAYSCMAELPDGSIGILYERGKSGPYEKITFARFGLDRLAE